VGEPPEEALLDALTTMAVRGPDRELFGQSNGSSLGHQEWREPSWLCINKRLVPDRERMVLNRRCPAFLSLAAMERDRHSKEGIRLPKDVPLRQISSRDHCRRYILLIRLLDSHASHAPVTRRGVLLAPIRSIPEKTESTNETSIARYQKLTVQSWP
jgi:hypothetical protein